jgi:hypothetical protein
VHLDVYEHDWDSFSLYVLLPLRSGAARHVQTRSVQQTSEAWKYGCIYKYSTTEWISVVQETLRAWNDQCDDMNGPLNTKHHDREVGHVSSHCGSQGQLFHCNNNQYIRACHTAGRYQLLKLCVMCHVSGDTTVTAARCAIPLKKTKDIYNKLSETITATATCF